MEKINPGNVELKKSAEEINKANLLHTVISGISISVTVVLVASVVYVGHKQGGMFGGEISQSFLDKGHLLDKFRLSVYGLIGLGSTGSLVIGGTCYQFTKRAKEYSENIDLELEISKNDHLGSQLQH